MGEVRYMISEAAKRVNVETHVLRYWEEELELPIGRTEMGHRYYTEENLQLFRCIKELKDQGMFLKDLKDLIPDMLRLKEKKAALTVAKTEVVLNNDSDSDPKLEQVQSLLGHVLQNIIEENNKVLEMNVSKNVSEKVVKEMDYLLREKERHEEERFRRLDTYIRQQQNFRREAAKSPTRKLRRLLGATEYI